MRVDLGRIIQAVPQPWWPWQPSDHLTASRFAYYDNGEWVHTNADGLCHHGKATADPAPSAASVGGLQRRLCRENFTRPSGARLPQPLQWGPRRRTGPMDGSTKPTVWTESVPTLRAALFRRVKSSGKGAGSRRQRTCVDGTRLAFSKAYSLPSTGRGTRPSLTWLRFNLNQARF